MPALDIFRTWPCTRCSARKASRRCFSVWKLNGWSPDGNSKQCLKKFRGVLKGWIGWVGNDEHDDHDDCETMKWWIWALQLRHGPRWHCIAKGGATRSNNRGNRKRYIEKQHDAACVRIWISFAAWILQVYIRL